MTFTPTPTLPYTHSRRVMGVIFSYTHPQGKVSLNQSSGNIQHLSVKGLGLVSWEKITLSTLPLCRPTEGSIGLKIVQGAHLWRAEAAQGQRYSASLAWPRPGDPEKTTTAGYQAHTAALVLALQDPPSLPPLPTRGIRSCLNPRDPAPNRGLKSLGSAGGQSSESQKPGKISPSFGLPGCWNGTH